jgi:hypothetical protein
MRCISCGGETQVVRVENDDTMTVPGYERQTLQCAACNETERRTIFVDPVLRRAEPTSVPAASASPMTLAASIVSEADRELDEGEALLRRAIEMVRGSIRSIAAGKPPGNRSGSTRGKKAPSRIVQIRHDPSEEPQYAAADTTSGLVLLRHRDNAHLRAMCDRLGWQVAEERVPSAGE